MADLDPELLERVIRWCAEAGRQTSAAEIQAALSPLRWDELLNVRALLADSPPARPLGPAALADLARGAPPDVAAEREREGRYRHELDDAADAARDATRQAAPAEKAPRAGRPRRGPRRPAAPVVHRKRDQPAPEAPPPPPAPPFERLLEPQGRAVLERLIREHGARRAFLLEALARWRRADGGAPADAELDALLDHHGLARAFAHRERDELLHALRAARGDRNAAAARVGLGFDALDAALARLGAAGDAERIRDDRRAELRARATLAERARLLAADAAGLADLGLLAEFEDDLRARLGEHLRALRAGGRRDVAAAFARSVSLEERDAAALAGRLGIDLAAGGGGAPAAPSASRPPGSRPPRDARGSRPSRDDRPARDARQPRGPRPSGPPRGAPGRARPLNPRSGAAQGRPVQGRTGPGRAGPGRPAQGRTGPGRPTQGRAGPGRPAQGRTGPSRPAQGRTAPRKAPPGGKAFPGGKGRRPRPAR